MRLFFRRDLSAFDVDFLVWDESGREIYRCVRKSSNTAFYTKLDITDCSGAKVAGIRRVPFAGFKNFELKAGSERVYLVMVPSQSGIYSYFYRKNWHISGNIAAKNFTVFDVDKSVVFSLKRHPDCCELDVADEDDVLICLCASICVNLINTVQKPAVKAAETV